MIRSFLNFLREKIVYLLDLVISPLKKKTAENHSMLETIKNVLIIDDNYDEVKGLEDELKKQDVGVICLNADEAMTVNLRPKDLLFLDFMLDDMEDKFKSIMSAKIRPLLNKHFCKKSPYGIVVWSKHEEKLDVFYEKLYIDALKNKEYDAPLFVIVLDKKQYLQSGNFQNIMSDIEEKIKQSASASFFINWNAGISKASYDSISDIYGLASSFADHDDEIKKILFKLAKSQTEIPKKELEKYITDNLLSDDAYKTMDEILCSNLKLNDRTFHDNLFSSIMPSKESFEEKIKIASHLNTKLFISEIPHNMTNIVPGNVYENGD